MTLQQCNLYGAKRIMKSRPDPTTKIFRAGPNGLRPNLLVKEYDETLQKTYQIFTLLKAHVWFVFESLLSSFYRELIILKR